MHMYLMLDAFNPILAAAVLEAKDLPTFVMCSLLFPCVGKLQIARIVQAVSRAMQCHFQRRKLGSANSGGCLSCGRKRTPPPTLHDWSDDMCRAHTRFTAGKPPDGKPPFFVKTSRCRQPYLITIPTVRKL